MYRKCPEHPQIAEILQNGELCGEKIAEMAGRCLRNNFQYLHVARLEYISDEDFADICDGRTQKAR